MARKKRVSITVHEKVLREARWRAAKRGQSLSLYVQEALRWQFRNDDEYDAAHRSWLKHIRELSPIRDASTPLPTREELYAERLRRYDEKK